MKKLLFGIFAHPDDEAFGPSASLYTAAKNGTDVHLILVTDGEAGNNPDNLPNLGEARLKEWEESRKRIGAASGLALHYPDGCLCNKLYLEIAEKITDHVIKVCGEYNEDVEVDFMTFDHDGVSGHLDHIAVSFITTYVFLKLKETPPKNARIQNLKYYNLGSELIKEANTNWIYMPAGKTNEFCDEIYSFKDISETKLQIMKAHYSQRDDMNQILLSHQNVSEDACNCDHFRYYKS